MTHNTERDKIAQAVVLAVVIAYLVVDLQRLMIGINGLGFAYAALLASVAVTLNSSAPRFRPVGPAIISSAACPSRIAFAADKFSVEFILAGHAAEVELIPFQLRGPSSKYLAAVIARYVCHAFVGALAPPVATSHRTKALTVSASTRAGQVFIPALLTDTAAVLLSTLTRTVMGLSPCDFRGLHVKRDAATGTDNVGHS